MKKKAKRQVVNPRLSVRDETGKLRAKAQSISERLGLDSISAGVAYALELADGETRRENAPVDWEKEPIESLRTLAVYGYDFRTRAAALAEIERRDSIESGINKYLSDGKNEIFELFVSIREKFDGSEYMQGKKDGLRTALALLGMPEMLQFNRGNGGAREVNDGD